MRKPLSPAMLKILEEHLWGEPYSSGGIVPDRPDEVKVRALPGERVLNRSDRPPVIERGVGHRTCAHTTQEPDQKEGVSHVLQN